MKGANFINLGEKLITVVEQRSKNKMNTSVPRVNGKISQVTLNKEDLFELTKNENFSDKQNCLFGQYLHVWSNWAADLKYKKKSNYEVIKFNLKQDGDEVIKGAFSKTKQANGEIKKFRFLEEDMYIKSGYTNRLGQVMVSRRQDYFPEKYKGYLWSMPQKDLLIVADAYGIGCKKKSLDQIAIEWGVQRYRVMQIKKHAMWDMISRATQKSLKPIKETTESKYTIEDYIEACKFLKDNKIYNYIRGIGQLTKDLPLINDEFLKQVGDVRRRMKVIDEWKVLMPSGCEV